MSFCFRLYEISGRKRSSFLATARSILSVPGSRVLAPAVHAFLRRHILSICAAGGRRGREKLLECRTCISFSSCSNTSGSQRLYCACICEINRELVRYILTYQIVHLCLLLLLWSATPYSSPRLLPILLEIQVPRDDSHSTVLLPVYSRACSSRSISVRPLLMMLLCGLLWAYRKTQRRYIMPRK